MLSNPLFDYGLPNQYAGGMKARPQIQKDESATIWQPEGWGKAANASKAGMLEALNNGTANAFSPKSIEDYNEHLRSNVASTMQRLGITLDDDEELVVGLDANSRITVAGLKDGEKAAALAKALNTARAVRLGGAKEEKALDKNIYADNFYGNSDYANSADSFEETRRRAGLIRLKDTANDTIRSLTGVDIDFSKLSLNDQGGVTGYPAELAWIFEGNYNAGAATDADKQRYATGHAVNHIVKTLLNEGYDTIPSVSDLGVSFTYGKNDMASPAPLDVEA